MNATVNQISKPTTSRKKLGLILVLCLVLYAVWPSSDSSDNELGDTVELATTLLEALDPKPANVESKQTEEIKPEYRQFSLKDALVHNPFTTPKSGLDNLEPGRDAALESNVSDDVSASPPGPGPLDVSAVFHSAKGSSAIINGEIYQVGDRLPSGYVVSEITHQRVRVTSGQQR